MWCSQVVSPNMFNMQLWETSGHAANYKENMFTFEVCHVFFNVHCVSVIIFCLISLITICFVVPGLDWSALKCSKVPLGGIAVYVLTIKLLT